MKKIGNKIHLCESARRISTRRVLTRLLGRVLSRLLGRVLSRLLRRVLSWLLGRVLLLGWLTILLLLGRLAVLLLGRLTVLLLRGLTVLLLGRLTILLLGRLTILLLGRLTVLLGWLAILLGRLAIVLWWGPVLLRLSKGLTHSLSHVALWLLHDNNLWLLVDGLILGNCMSSHHGTEHVSSLLNIGWGLLASRLPVALKVDGTRLLTLVLDVVPHVHAAIHAET